MTVVMLIAVARAAMLARRFYVRRRTKAAYERLLERYGKQRSALPLGRTNLYFASYTGLPAGDRNAQVAWAVEDRTTLQIDGVVREVRQAAFEWRWEQVVPNHIWYRASSTVAAAIELPLYVPRRITVRPISSVERLGAPPAFEVESDQFNRRFVVETSERQLAVKLLDANLQILLSERFAGRCISIEDRLLLVTGEPSHRDDSLYGVIGALPAVEQDVRTLAAAIPAEFWRACPNRPQPTNPDETGTSNSPR